ncbi:hypothetical protein MS10711_3043 [Escherichia coli]|nr:hypothetical protein MS10858_3049 [Escherichia coli]WMN33426.1 hypothetical protein MS10711_3043 [Escherichia coli]
MPGITIFYSLQVMVHPFLQVQNMTGKLRFEVNDNRGLFHISGNLVWLVAG